MSQQPNFLIIIADDLGFSDIGCYGGEINTPNLDQLAAEGVRMTGFHSAAACSPTRAMLLSGQDNHVAGLGAMAEWRDKIGDGKLSARAGYEGHLNFKVAALPEILQDAGYHTSLSGKWHLGMTPETAPHSRGFTTSFTMLSGCHNHYAYEPQYGPPGPDGVRPEAGISGFAPAVATKRGMYNIDGREIDIPTNLSGSDDGFYSTPSFSKQLLDYIREAHSSSTPFLAVLPFTAPHWPLQAPKRLRDRYKGRYGAGPCALREERLARMAKLGLIEEGIEPHPFVNATKWSEWDEMSAEERALTCRAMETYAAMVESLDESVGQVIKGLEDLGVKDDTVIFFMSDNGAEGSAWEAVPHMGDVIKVIHKYYDNSLEVNEILLMRGVDLLIKALQNIGEANSFVWYGPFWAQASTAPSRLMKEFATQGGIRVPCIIRYPPLTRHTLSKPGTVIDQPLTVMDIMPTLLDLAGVAHPVRMGQPSGKFRDREVVGMKGKSWRGMFEKGERCHDETEELGWELHGRAGLRIDNWKITFVPPPFGPGKWQLYDLHKDPGEIYDLKDQYPEKYKELSEAWERYVEQNGVAWIHDAPNAVFDTDANVVEDPKAWMPHRSGVSRA